MQALELVEFITIEERKFVRKVAQELRFGPEKFGMFPDAQGWTNERDARARFCQMLGPEEMCDYVIVYPSDKTIQKAEIQVNNFLYII